MRARREPAILLLLLAALLCTARAGAQTEDWNAVVANAAGQTVYFNAWGGDRAINRYIEWAAERVRVDYDIELHHVRVTDIAESVTRITAERTAGRNRDGSVDLLWINGENFAAMKRAGLLYGPWAHRLPNAARINWHGNPTTLVDGALETEGYELPWGTAALTLFFDTARVAMTPGNPGELLEWIEQHPGRFSYPQPPSFLGSAFLKQLLLALIDNPARLSAPAAADFDDRHAAALALAGPCAPRHVAQRPPVPTERPGAARPAGGRRTGLDAVVQPVGGQPRHAAG